MTVSFWASQFTVEQLAAPVPVLEKVAAHEIDSIAAPAHSLSSLARHSAAAVNPRRMKLTALAIATLRRVN